MFPRMTVEFISIFFVVLMNLVVIMIVMARSSFSLIEMSLCGVASESVGTRGRDKHRSIHLTSLEEIALRREWVDR